MTHKSFFEHISYQFESVQKLNAIKSELLFSKKLTNTVNGMAAILYNIG